MEIKIEKRDVEVKKIVTEEVFVLTLTKEEAAVLLKVSGQIGGCDSGTNRKTINTIWDRLRIYPELDKLADKIKLNGILYFQ